MKKYQELENKIAELQKEVDRLKKEENELPKAFDRWFCIKFLKTFSSSVLCISFDWRDTPQGEHYWDKIYNNLLDESDSYKVPKDAIIYIQSLIIKSYQ